MAEVKTEAAEFFHRYAAGFDSIYGTRKTVVNGWVNRLFRRSMMLRFRGVIDGAQPTQGATVIDIGCGPGHYSAELAKNGARRVLGLDFAENMLEIARKRAAVEGVSDKCEFVSGDFDLYTFNEKFDYAVVMGFMDYVADPSKTIKKVLSITNKKAMFSFPKSGGFLAWQRQQRYKVRCPLYLYSREQLEKLFAGTCKEVRIEDMGRDYFVTAIVA
jgi:ubiquinone/menaquinone biosynthesis C-methylase UbiE